MKKVLLFTLMMASVIGTLKAFDFSSVAPSGQTLYYSFVSGEEVYVVFPCRAWNGYEKPTGFLEIPSIVSHNGNNYIVRGVANDAFNGCNNLSAVILGDSIQGVSDYAFYNCNNLSYISMGSQMNTIQSYAFYQCPLHSVFLPMSVMTVGPYSFIGTTTLYVENSVFDEMTNFGSVGSSVQRYYEENGLFYGDSLYSVLIGCDYNLSNVALPSSVTTINEGAFLFHHNLSNINFANVSTIGDNAFRECVNLHSATISDNVTSLGTYVFCNCNSLSSATINNRIHSIPAGLFSGCSSLPSISLGANINAIGDYAFYGCSALTSVSLSDDVTDIGTSAFENCSGLTSVTTGRYINTLGANAFSGCRNIATVNYNAENCRNGGGAFQGLTGLTTLNIGNNVQYIPNNMFAGCTGLVTITLPDAVTEIGSGVFSGCVNLTNANLGNGLTAVSPNCFKNCLRLTTVRLSDALSSIGSEAFYSCGIVGELVIPQGVITIDTRAFYECYGINKITALGRVAPVLGSSVFYGVDSNIVVNIPCGTTNMYAGRWPQFHNFSEMPFLFNAISENVNKGTVTVEQEPTCDNPYALIRATPKVGYHFDHWSDGNTSNPYSYTATGSVTLIAYFAENVGIASAKLDDNGISITVENGQIVVHGDYTGLVRVFDIMGRLVASAKAGEALPAMPNGVYIVQIGKTIAKKVVILQ